MDYIDSTPISDLIPSLCREKCGKEIFRFLGGWLLSCLITAEKASAMYMCTHITVAHAKAYIMAKESLHRVKADDLPRKKMQ